MSFKDTFTRGDSGENKLKYDDTAFYFFFLAVGSVVSIPMIISIIKPLLINPSKHIISKSCPCEDCKIKSQKIYKQVKNKFFTKGYFFKILFQIYLLYLLYLAQQAISQTPQMKYFDPYETLEIQRGVEEKEIKQAYRRLSKIWHPDKNPSPEASEKFILLTKAYECLTDDTKKHICEKYGNPDGPGAMQVAIAMPSFLLKKENHVSVLAMFFVALFIIVPTTFYCCTENLGKYDEHGIYIQNKGLFYLFLNEQLLISKCPELLASCREYALKIKGNNTNQEHDLQKLNQKNVAQCFKSVFDKQSKIPQQSWIPYIILCAYLLGEDIPESLQQEAHIIISEAPQITQSVINFLYTGHPAFIRKKIPIEWNPARYKFMGYTCLRTLIEFQQNICAGQWVSKGKNYIEIAQNQLKTIVSDSNRKQHAYPEFDKLLKAYHENNQTLFKPKKANKKNEEQEYEQDELQLLEKLKQELSLFPQIQVSYTCGTEDEKESTDRDVMDLKITLKILNFKNIQNNYAHLIRYYGQRINRWHVIVTNDHDEILHYQLLGGQKDTFETSYKFQEFNVGKNKLTIVIKSDTYRGYDQDIPVEFEVLDHRKVNREIFIHPEDKELDNQPSFMQQYILGGKAVNVSDDEEEEEDENEDTGKKKKNKKGKQQLEENQEEQLENDQNQQKTKEINLGNYKNQKFKENEEEEEQEEEDNETDDKKQK